MHMKVMTDGGKEVKRTKGINLKQYKGNKDTETGFMFQLCCTCQLYRHTSIHPYIHTVFALTENTVFLHFSNVTKLHTRIPPISCSINVEYNYY